MAKFCKNSNFDIRKCQSLLSSLSWMKAVLSTIKIFEVYCNDTYSEERNKLTIYPFLKQTVGTLSWKNHL